MLTSDSKVRTFAISKDFQFLELEHEDGEIQDATTANETIAFAQQTVGEDGTLGILIWPNDLPIPQFVKSRLLKSPIA